MLKEDIERTIGQVLKADNYKMINPSRESVYFIKRYSDDLAFYVRCSEDRCEGLKIEMLFLPIDIPDDNLLSLEAGIHVNILTVYWDITDDLIASAGKRAIAIEKNIGDLSNVILNELNEPYFYNRRIADYKEERAIYGIVKEDTAIRQEFNCLKKNVGEMIKIKSMEQVYQLSYDFIEQLSIDYFKNKGIDLELSDIKSKFAAHVYAQCILDV